MDHTGRIEHFEHSPPSLLCLSEMLERSAERYGSCVALRKRTAAGWRVYTYAELLFHVKSVGSFLRRTSHRKGDFIGLIGENGPEWVIAFMAIQWVGAVAVPLDSKAKETDLCPIFDHSGLKSIFASPKNVEWLKKMQERNVLRQAISLFSMSDVTTEKPSLALAGPQVSTGREELKLDDLAIVQYTSGTTGNPKGVMLTHRNISSNIQSLFQAVRFDQSDRFFSVLPIYHVYEGTAGNWLPLSVGASVTYSRSLKSKEMLEDARDTEPTMMLAVPLLLEKMLLGIQKRVNESPAPIRAIMIFLKAAARLFNGIHRGFGNRIFWRGLRKRMGFGKLRFFVSGGAALSPKVQKGLEDFGFTVLQGYGLSETSPVLALNPPRRTRLGSAGLPIPGVDLRIMDPDSQGIGEIAAKGQNVMPGYYKNDLETRGVFTDNHFFLTGDMGYQDEEGYLFITGRKKTTIVTKGGKNIFPEEIESLMIESPYIEEILVIAGRHPRTDEEEVQAIIYPNRERMERHLSERAFGPPEEREKAIRDLLQREIDERGRTLAAYKRIVHFKIRDEEFPKTATQKIKRYLFETKSS